MVLASSGFRMEPAIPASLKMDYSTAVVCCFLQMDPGVWASKKTNLYSYKSHMTPRSIFAMSGMKENLHMGSFKAQESLADMMA